MPRFARRLQRDLFLSQQVLFSLREIRSREKRRLDLHFISARRRGVQSKGVVVLAETPIKAQHGPLFVVLRLGFSGRASIVVHANPSHERDVFTQKLLNDEFIAKVIRGFRDGGLRLDAHPTETFRAPAERATQTGRL